MNILGVITARGGSKGLPGKNLRLLGSRTLVAHAIASAKESRLLTRFLLSTDDEAIAREGRKAGAEVPFMRPKELATDEISIVPVLQHAVRWMEANAHFQPDAVVLLQAVSPFRRGAHIDAAIQKFIDTGADSVLTLREPDYSPYFMKRVIGDRVVPLFPELAGKVARRQDAPPAYRPTGAVYVTRTSVLMREGNVLGKDTRGVIMPFEASINIDTPWDFMMAEILLKEKTASTPRSEF